MRAVSHHFFPLGVAAAVAAGIMMLARAQSPPRATFGREAPTHETLGDGWIKHRVELVASSVDLDHLGQHTHANWVVFTLPFDVTGPSVRNVGFAPHARVPTDVGALPTFFGCVRTPTLGGVDEARWGKFTVNGVAGTRLLADHPRAPTTSTRAYAVNVPTRVANHASCFASELKDPTTWRLVVTWESPPQPHS